MKFRSKENLLSGNNIKRVENALCAKPGFSLVETVTALIILALISSSVLVVIDRCITSATDSSLRMQAFEVARENMEAILSKSSVTEMVEYGNSDKYPEVQWQTAVETFYEPLTERIWVRGVCSAQYIDTASDTQTVELVQWLTSLTKEQLLEMLEQKQKQKEKEWPAEEIIKTVEEAADYADVDVATIQQWIEDGMPLTRDGFYIAGWLDLYIEAGGEPTSEEIAVLAKEYESPKAKSEHDDKAKEYEPDDESVKPDDEESVEPEDDEKSVEPQRGDLVCGVPREELLGMPIEEIFQLLLNCEE